MLKVSMTSWAICFQMNKPFLTKHVKKKKEKRCSPTTTNN